MIKVLYVSRVPITAVRFILPLAKKMRERGNVVEFAFGPGEGLTEMGESGFPYSLVLMNKKSGSLKNADVIWKLKKIICEGNYDVVHTYSPIIGLYGRLAASIAKTPVIIHSVIGSIMAEGVPIAHRLFFIGSELLTSRMVDLFITLNDSDAHDMVKYRLAPSNKVISLKYEYGVDLGVFNPEKVAPEHVYSLRRMYNLSEGIPVIGFVGRMIGAKGILDLFEAYRLIRSKGIQVKLVYLGDVLNTDKDQNAFLRLKCLVKEACLDADVVFLGFQDNVPLYISLMDVVVLPSHSEGFPRIPVEAGAMGKVSISTATSGADVAIVDGETGYITPIRNAILLAEALEKILKVPGRADEMGKKARKRVTELFDQNRLVEKQIDIYNNYFSKYSKTKSLSV